MSIRFSQKSGEIGCERRTVVETAWRQAGISSSQTNKSTMYSIVQTVCEEFRESVWKDHVAYARHFADFSREAGAIQAWKLVQETARDGVALTKERLQDILIEDAAAGGCAVRFRGGGEGCGTAGDERSGAVGFCESAG